MNLAHERKRQRGSDDGYSDSMLGEDANCTNATSTAVPGAVEQEKAEGEPMAKRVEREELTDKPSNEMAPLTAASSSTESQLGSCSDGLVRFISVFGSRKGDREEMEDRHLTLDSLPLVDNSTTAVDTPPPGRSVIKRSALFALFDGHGGIAAADYCHSHFSNKLIGTFNKYVPPQSDWPTIERAMKKIFVESYKAVDEGFLVEARKHKPVLKDGTTATTLLLVDNTIYSANVGDSQAFVCRAKPEAKERWISLPLTTEHSPTVFTERMRIQKAGGMVKDGRVLGVLEVSRSIGDGQFKAHGVTSSPDIRKLTLTASDLFLLLACDGLWKSFRPEDAIRFAISKFTALKASYVASSAGQADKDVWTKVVDELSAEAVMRGCGDNVSLVMVVFLENVEKFIT